MGSMAFYNYSCASNYSRWFVALCSKLKKNVLLVHNLLIEHDVPPFAWHMYHHDWFDPFGLNLHQIGNYCSRPTSGIPFFTLNLDQDHKKLVIGCNHKSKSQFVYFVQTTIILLFFFKKIIIFLNNFFQLLIVLIIIFSIISHFKINHFQINMNFALDFSVSSWKVITI